MLYILKQLLMTRTAGHAQQMVHMMLQQYSTIGALSKLCEEYAQCDDEGESILVGLGKLSINKLGGATPLYMTIYEGSECYHAASQGLVLSRLKQRDIFLAATNPAAASTSRR